MVITTLDVVYNKSITNIIGYITDCSGAPLCDARAFWYPEGRGPQKIASSDIAGLFTFSLREGEKGTLVIVDMHFDKKLVVPILDANVYEIDYKDIDPVSRFNWPTIDFTPNF